MIKNIGKTDRITRLIFGVLCLGAILIFNPNTLLTIILLIAGLFNLFQSAFSWCAWNAFLGKNTCPIEDKN